MRIMTFIFEMLAHTLFHDLLFWLNIGQIEEVRGKLGQYNRKYPDESTETIRPRQTKTYKSDQIKPLQIRINPKTPESRIGNCFTDD